MDKAMTVETVTTKGGALMFGVSEGKLRQMCLTQKINSAKKVGKYWFISVAELRKIFKGEE